MEFKRNLAAFLVENFDSKTKDREHQHSLPPPSEDSNGRRSAVVTSEIQDYNKIMEVEAVLLDDLIKPLIFLMKYSLPCRIILKYDPVAKCIVCENGSIFRKIICVLWEILVIHRLVIRAIPTISSEENLSSKQSTESIVSQVAYVTFTVFHVTFFYLFWMKANCVCAIFNRTLGLAEALHLKHRSPPRIRAVKCGVHGSWLFVALYVTATAVLYIIQLFRVTNEGRMSRLSMTNGSEPGDVTAKSVRYQFDVTEIHSANEYNLVLQVTSTLGSFTTIFSWMMSYFFMGVWALFFRQLIMLFYWRLQAKYEHGQLIIFPHEIRTFNKIVSIMDDFNKISGFANLLGAIVIVTYISTSAKHAFSGLANILEIGVGFHLLLSYIPMIAAAFMAAEVPRVAGNFAGILKDEYGRFTHECGDPAESLCGIAIVHYDLSTSNVGLKGSGFYTVSYSFITAIASVIVTYSILVFQLFPQDNTVDPG